MLTGYENVEEVEYLPDGSVRRRIGPLQQVGRSDGE